MVYSETVAPRLLNGKLALVTGAGQGNGRAIALGLAQAGARVVVTDMNTAAVQETARLVQAGGGNAWAYTLDVTVPDACTALAARVNAEVGAIDILVNNAGIIIREGTDSENAAANWKKTIDVNVHGTFNVSLAWLPAIQSTRGSIIISRRLRPMRARRAAWAIPPPKAPSRCSRNR